MSAEKQRSDESALPTILAEIESGRIELYSNILDKPYVSVCVHEQPKTEWYLFDARFRSWLVAFVWEADKILLRRSEIQSILELLAGLSMRERIASIADRALLQLIETEPVVATVLEFMHTKQRVKSGMEQLWKRLEKFAKKRGLATLGGNRFPGGSNVLSRKLREHTSVLKKAGIVVVINRNNGCKVILTRRSDGANVESSAEPSSQNPLPNSEFCQTDDQKARVKALRQRWLRPKNALIKYEP